jgi:short-subunit dehydrogenase/2'-5' RNA ligase
LEAGEVSRHRIGVVLLVPQPLATELDGLRRALNAGERERVAPHITLVPPINLRDREVADAIDCVRKAAADVEPFELDLGPATTFAPVTPTVHLEVAGAGAEGLAGLRAAIVSGRPLDRPDEHEWVPHVTLAQEVKSPVRLAAALEAMSGWRQSITFDRVHVLRQQSDQQWVPIADAALGSPAVIGRGGIEVALTMTARPDPEAAALLSIDGAPDGEGRPWAVTARINERVVGASWGWSGLRRRPHRRRRRGRRSRPAGGRGVAGCGRRRRRRPAALETGDRMKKVWDRALVTGASSGIGEAMARQLAASGTELVVVARSKDALEKLAAEVTVPVEVLAADLGDPAQRAAVEERLRDSTTPIDLLVNNAGFGTSGPFLGTDADTYARMVELNITALVSLTRAAVPGMLERRKGSVLNVSSLGGFQPTPGFAVYGATKAFVTSFSEALSVELRGSGVTATAVHPGFTRTNFQAAAGAGQEGPSFLWQSAEDCAAEALAGTARGKAVVVTGLPNRFVAAISHPMPRAVKRRAAGMVGARAT